MSSNSSASNNSPSIKDLVEDIKKLINSNGVLRSLFILMIEAWIAQSGSMAPQQEQHRPLPEGYNLEEDTISVEDSHDKKGKIHTVKTSLKASITDRVDLDTLVALISEGRVRITFGHSGPMYDTNTTGSIFPNFVLAEGDSLAKTTNMVFKPFPVQQKDGTVVQGPAYAYTPYDLTDRTKGEDAFGPTVGIHMILARLFTTHVEAETTVWRGFHPTTVTKEDARANWLKKFEDNLSSLIDSKMAIRIL
jgi:hypothetical protein